MHLEFGVTQKPVVMQSLKQSNLYEFNFAKNACTNGVPEAHSTQMTHKLPRIVDILHPCGPMPECFCTSGVF